ncbi:MAG: hypothetical protein JJV97_03675 [SAR324 cluster bacterium]|nr:hypothetical protein [SAR324 cluster bacterium]
MVISFQNQVTTYADLIPLHQRWSVAMASPFKFYKGVSHHFYEELWKSTSAEGQGFKPSKKLMELFFDSSYLSQLENHVEKLLELKFQIKRLLKDKPELAKVGNDLVEVANRFTKLCQLHLEINKYQKSTLNVVQLVSMVLKVNDINTRWERYCAKEGILQDFILDLERRGKEENNLKIVLNIPTNEYFSLLITASFCRLLVDCSYLFDDLYGKSETGLRIRIIETIKADPCQLICQISVPKAWNLPLGGFLSDLINFDASEKQEDGKIVKMIGDLLFFHKQKLKAPKKMILKHQKTIEKSLVSLPKGCSVMISEVNLGIDLVSKGTGIDGGDSSSGGGDDSFRLPRSSGLNDDSNQPDIAKKCKTLIKDGVANNKSNKEDKTKKAVGSDNSSNNEQTDQKKEQNIDPSSKQHVGFLTGG